MKKFFLPGFVILLLTAASFAQAVKRVNEPVILQNYFDAPVIFKDLKIKSRTLDSKHWLKICVNFSVEIKPGKEFNSLSYEVVDKNGQMLVGVKTWMVKGLMSQCFSNDVYTDEGHFVIRPIFVESEHATVWESKDYKATMRRFENFKFAKRPKNN